ncbi:MAG: ABC transporter permease [Acidobacteriaceae bacterium]
MRRIWIDLRFTLRQLKKSPGFTFVAVAILALGIGATTTIYTLLDQALLRSLPVRNPDRLVQLNGSGAFWGYTESFNGDNSNVFSYPMYRNLRDRNKVFSGMLAATPTHVGLEWHNQPELADAELVSGNYFDVLGVKPALGRLLLPSDNRVKNGSPVVVLSFGYWQRHFGADPRILNQTIGINGHPFTMVGVAAPGFHSVIGGNTPAVFAPMLMKPEVEPGRDDLDDHQSRWLSIIARLKPGMTRAKAQAGMQPLWHALRADELKEMSIHSKRSRVAFLVNSHLTLRDGARGFSSDEQETWMPFLIVMLMAALVLLMACANVAGLMLVRAAGRVREMSVRYALGARRSQIVQQLLMEGLLLGLAGGALGLWLAPGVATLLERRILDQTTGELPFSTHPDLRILAFTFALSVAVSVFFSMAPALQFWRPDVTTALKQQAPTVSGGSLRLQHVAVGVQIGLSVLLLVAAGLFVRTLYNLKSVNVGFSTDHLIEFRVDPRMAGYAPDAVQPLYQRMLTKLSYLPGARAVGATSDPVLADWNTGYNITIAGYKAGEDEDMNVEHASVSPGYFSALGVALLAGHAFTDADRADGAKVAVVNESFARHYFGDPQKALGHFFGSGAGNGVKTDIQIVGIVRNTKHDGVDDANILPSVFTPYTQADQFGSMEFYIRTWQAPDAAMAMIRNSMHDLDSKLVLSSLETMDAQVNEDLDSQRTIALLAISFGILALLISAIGLHAVLAYATAQRTREIGLRIALGASRMSIARMVLLDVLRLVAISVAVAMPAAWLMTRWVRGQLYGVSGHDPATMAAVVAAVVAVVLLAAILPVRRAIGVDPMTALRYE